MNSLTPKGNSHMPQVRFKTLFKATGITLLSAVLVGCTTSPEDVAAKAETTKQQEKEIASSKGETVPRICPRSSDGWRALDGKRMLIEAQGQWYYLELVGSCDPDSAFSAITTRSSGASSCLERGDDVFTGRPRYGGGRCVVTAIHEWKDEDTAE